jgi:hypothetical protein
MPMKTAANPAVVMFSGGANGSWAAPVLEHPIRVPLRLGGSMTASKAGRNARFDHGSGLACGHAGEPTVNFGRGFSG